MARPNSIVDVSSKKQRRVPIPTVDIILRKESDERTILLERRKIPPFKGKMAIPGGHVDYGETVEHAALRELFEECSVRARLTDILGVYSHPKRDPRGQRITTVFVADLKSGTPKARDDAKSVEWINAKDVISSGGLAFDHELILKDYMKWLKSKGTFWSTKGKIR